MSVSNKISLDMEINEIIRLIDEYQEKVTNGTSSTEDFMAITDMEEALGKLRACTNNIFTDIQSKLVNQIDQNELLRKKKLTTGLKK